MRIIAGILKGRQIKVPKSKLVRPTTDRTREALFNYMNNFIDFEGITVCDIYAGSGALGFESLSRGAGKVDFVEKSYLFSKNLQNNISSLEQNTKCRLFNTSALKFSRMKEHISYDLILADPPFFKEDIYVVAQNLLEGKFVSPGGYFFIERSIQTRDQDILNFKAEPIRRMGDSVIYSLNN